VEHYVWEEWGECERSEVNVRGVRWMWEEWGECGGGVRWMWEEW
jgi:hypothetical protein